MTLFFLCLKIFFARVIDVTLGTIRTVYTIKGRTISSGIIAFFEIFIWFIVAKEALNNEINNIFIVISYAGGYAFGTVQGTVLSKKFISSLISVEVITDKATKKNIQKIREDGFGVSAVDTIYNYKNSPKRILYITLNSRYLEKLKKKIKEIDEKAFIVIHDSKIAVNGFMK